MSAFWLGFVADVSHAVRVYRRTPTSTAFAVGGLAAAIACVSALLPLFSDLLLKPHPGFARSGALVTIVLTDGTRTTPLPMELLEQIQERISSLDALAGVFSASLSAEYQGKRQPAAVEIVTKDYFAGLRPHMRLGRGLNEKDHHADAEPVAVLSHTAWLAQFGGRADVLGATVTLSGRPYLMSIAIGKTSSAPGEQSRSYRVIGVLAPESSGTFGVDTDYWIPFEQAGSIFIAAGSMAGKAPVLHAVARLRPGATLEAARVALGREFRGLGSGGGVPQTGHLETMSGVVRDPQAQRDAQRQVRLFLIGAVLLAAVAAANVSLFLLSRAPSRQRELSIRSAVGATSRRLVRQLATEAFFLVALATAFGWLISIWLAALMQHQPLLARAQWRTVSSFDWRVLAMIAALSLLLTALVALAPIVGLRRTGIAAGTKLFSGRATWSQRLAGIVQISIAGAVVSVAAAFGWQLWLLTNADVGFRTEDVIVVAVRPQDPGKLGFGVNTQETVLRRERQRVAIAAMPGVQAVAFGNSVPGRMTQTMTRLGNPNAPGEFIDAQLLSVDSSYRSLLNMRLVHGVDLDSKDLSGVLINETLARSLWNRTDVVGEMLGLSNTRVVGVLKDTAFVHPADKIKPMMYRSSAFPGMRELILVRSKFALADLRNRLQEKVRLGELEFEIADVQRLDEIWSATLAPDRARSILTGVSAAIVVLLAALGFYSTQSYLVNAGRREYAIRAAIGAGPKALGRLALLRGISLGVPGWVLAGLLSAISVAWLRDGFISTAVTPNRIVLGVSLALAALIVLTAVSPAWRARHTEPAPLLREE